MGIVQKNEISLELERKSYGEICSQVLFHKNKTFFFLAIPAQKPKSEDNFFKASAARIYGEFFSKFPQEFFHRSWVSYTGKFRKIPREVCSGVRQNFSTYSI
jgi:hypothetical protein